jgi:hypothetical protein
MNCCKEQFYRKMEVSTIEHVGPQTCSFPLRGGNLVIPIIDTLMNYEQICKAIEQVVDCNLSIAYTTYSQPKDYGSLYPSVLRNLLCQVKEEPSSTS